MTGFGLAYSDWVLLEEREGSTTITETGSAEGSADFNQIAWYPQQKIEIASKKLRGENPGCKNTCQL